MSTSLSGTITWVYNDLDFFGMPYTVGNSTASCSTDKKYVSLLTSYIHSS